MSRKPLSFIRSELLEKFTEKGATSEATAVTINDIIASWGFEANDKDVLLASSDFLVRQGKLKRIGPVTRPPSDDVTFYLA